MHEALLASHNGVFYTFSFESIEGVQNWVRERDIEALTSSCGRFDFWTSPLLRRGTLQPINRAATKILVGATRFSGADVPVLRGPIVITSHDQAGDIIGLTPEQIIQLIELSYRLPRQRDVWALEWRLGRLDRAELRQARRESRRGRGSFAVSGAA
ncbi:hypothetical protein [Mycolicibacterium chlorophenolicum]|uniref:Uncharacterized protein n=1 Tax=Mycolicibacterium chlorophenolicum TaxID=37916 RepID=A0A0J6VFJ2_9MYCO|nr:hypothetical protein [Mycolicibacterium chlorophenolicum]KMO69785.1 hypothetical protein MCHLDSM_05897 [Mycolicibacterium chlorophenolicum]